MALFTKGAAWSVERTVRLLPIISGASYTNNFAAPRFQLTMIPSGVHPMIASSECSTMEARNFCASSAVCSAGLGKVGKEEGSSEFPGIGFSSLVRPNLARYCLCCAFVWGKTSVSNRRDESFVTYVEILDVLVLCN